MPEPAPWVRRGQLLLTTGFAWPAKPAQQRQQVRLLNGRGLAAMALAVPRYHEHFSAAARREADSCGLPLLEVPFAVPFAQITEELHRAIIAEQYNIIGRSEEIHRALTRAAARGADLKELARSLGELIGRSVSFEDPNARILGEYVLASPNRDRALSPGASSSGAQQRVEPGPAQRVKLLDELRTSEAWLRIAAMPEIGLSARVGFPIRLGAEFVGGVWIMEGTTALSELDNRAAEHAALVAALHVAHQRELAGTEARLGYASFLSLLEAETDDAQTLDRARLLDFDPDGLQRVAIAVVLEALPLNREGFLRRERVASAVRNSLQSAGARPLLTTSLNYVAFLIPDGIDATNILHGLGDDTSALVVGRAYTGMHGVRRSYREAQSLLNYRGGARLRFFEEALVPRVLMGDSGAREAFVDDLFGGLSGRKGGPTLRAALLAFAGAGFHFKQTALNLGIHQNTLRYRLARAVEATRLDLADPENRFRLQLAVHVLEFLNNGTAETCTKGT